MISDSINGENYEQFKERILSDVANGKTFDQLRIENPLQYECAWLGVVFAELRKGDM